jgi:purine-binding chemotaxis protein CheW
MTNKNGRQPHLPSNNSGQLAHIVRTDPALPENVIDPETLAEIWAKRAQLYAAPLPVEATGRKRDLLVFSLHGERYGIEVGYVRALYPLRRFTPVPRTPDFVIGIFSARGRLISIIDLWAFFGLGNVRLSNETKIVVVRDEKTGIEVGIVANEVEDVITIYDEDLAPALATQNHTLAEFTQGIAPGMLAVLDLDSLLNNGQLIINQEIN